MAKQMEKRDGSEGARYVGAILVVDDSRVVRAMIGASLRSAGFDVQEAENGRAAVGLLSSRLFDVVVTDLHMPELDGFRLLEQCKRLEQSPEVVILTGVHDMDAAIRALRLGAHDFLTKPPGGREGVVLTVARAVEKKRLRDTNARLLREMEALTRTDSLTGVLNRRAFDEALNQEALRAHRYDLPLSLVMLDADHFKAINDTYGHPVGDDVLRNLARRFSGELRLTDTLYRYGGEEFAVILPHTSQDGALGAAARLVEAVAAAPVRVGPSSLRVTVSAGIASLQGTAVTAAELVRDADRALYTAKRSGRNRACTACASGSRSASVVLAPAALATVASSGPVRAFASRRRRPAQPLSRAS